MSVILEVTQDDIDCGIRNSASSCPIARAVKRTFPGKTVSVNATDIGVGGTYIKTQPLMSEFVNKFDKEGSSAVKPFKHVLDVSV